MATSTTNLGLIKPDGTDKIRIAQINQNMDTLDSKIGAVGNTDLQSQVSANNQAIATIKNAHNFGQYTSLATFKSDLLTFMQNVPSFEPRYIQFVFTSTVDPFKAWSTFTGYAQCIQNGTNSLYFDCNVTSNNAECIVIGYSNGTWFINELAIGNVSTLLTNQSCAFTTSYASLGKSFTLTKPSVVRIDVAYNNSLPVSFGCKPIDTAGAGSKIYVENANKTENVAGLSATGWLEAGTYYLWGSAKTAGNNNVSVYAVG